MKAYLSTNLYYRKLNVFVSLIKSFWHDTSLIRWTLLRLGKGLNDSSV